MRVKKNSLLSFEDVYNFALKKLSFRDYSEKELEKKLLEQDASKDNIEKTFKKLKEYSYINDDRFAKSIFEGWLLKKDHGIGYLKLFYKKKFIPEEIADKYINLCDEDLEVQKAKIWLQKCLRKNRTKYSLNDIKSRNSMKRSLIYRGFGFDAINRAFYELEDFDDSDSCD